MNLVLNSKSEDLIADRKYSKKWKFGCDITDFEELLRTDVNFSLQVLCAKKTKA